MIKRKEFTYQYSCEDCGAGFFQVKPRGGVTRYCDKCASKRSAASNRERQRRYRERHKKAKAATKTAQSRDDLPASVGARPPLARAGMPVRSVGLYADLPEPERTAKRRKVGIAEL